MFRAQQCSKHVQEYGKPIKKTRICTLSWLIAKIILTCTVSKTSKENNIILSVFRNASSWRFGQKICCLLYKTAFRSKFTRDRVPAHHCEELASMSRLVIWSVGWKKLGWDRFLSKNFCCPLPVSICQLSTIAFHSSSTDTKKLRNW